VPLKHSNAQSAPPDTNAGRILACHLCNSITLKLTHIPVLPGVTSPQSGRLPACRGTARHHHRKGENCAAGGENFARVTRLESGRRWGNGLSWKNSMSQGLR
jgi:hypothetical protein